MKTIERTCVFGCGFSDSISVPDASWDNYNAGAMAQNAFPFLSDGQREFFIISGICEPCFDNLFGE